MTALYFGFDFVGLYLLQVQLALPYQVFVQVLALLTSPLPPTLHRTFIKAKGFEPKKSGKDFVLLCPFHDDTNPSLRITPDVNLFHCPACGAGGCRR